MEYGIQLYSVRDMTQNDFEGAVRQVAALGYKSVEPAGFFGRTAEQVNALMEETGLRISGTHSQLLDLVNKYEETLAFHKAIKNPCYIVPGYSMKNQAEIDGFVNYVNDLAPKLEKEGITLTDADYEAGLAKYKEMYGSDTFMKDNNISEEALREALLWDKAMEFLADNYCDFHTKPAAGEDDHVNHDH